MILETPAECGVKMKVIINLLHRDEISARSDFVYHRNYLNPLNLFITIKTIIPSNIPTRESNQPTGLTFET